MAITPLLSSLFLESAPKVSGGGGGGAPSRSCSQSSGLGHTRQLDEVCLCVSLRGLRVSERLGVSCMLVGRVFFSELTTSKTKFNHSGVSSSQLFGVDDAPDELQPQA